MTSPATPTHTTTRGFSISWGSLSAVRNTALTSAPMTSARIQPNVFLLVAWVFSAKRTATRATVSAITSLSMWKESESIARDAVTLLTTSSTMKKLKVRQSMQSRRPLLFFIYLSFTDTDIKVYTINCMFNCTDNIIIVNT
uniref:Uncharacterized protein n=1 Tax=Astyanax mexicanus TaxID=7994 RepID=A0A3B1KEY5_ASTMX